MNLQDPVLQRRMFTVLIAALLGYLYFGSTFLPVGYRLQKVKIEQISAELEKSERKIQIANSQAGRLDVLQPRLERLERDWRRIERLLPKAEEMPEFLENLSKHASAAGVQIDLLQPAKPTQGEGVKSRNVEVRVHGDYHDVGRFLSSLANDKRVIGTSGLSVNGISQASQSLDIEGGKKKGTVQATFTAILYMLGSGAAPATGGENDAKG